MEKMCFDSSVSVVAYIKDGIKYGMACAWGMQADYDKVLMLLGSQSDTGNNIKKGDIVGVSVLSKDQYDLSLRFGDKHSKTFDKFDGIKYEVKDTAIVLPSSSRVMIGKVIDVLHLNGIESDNLLYIEITSNIKNNDNFLTYQGFKDYE